MLTYSMDEKDYIRGFKVFTRNNQVQSVVTLDVPIPISTIKIASIKIYFRILHLACDNAFLVFTLLKNCFIQKRKTIFALICSYPSVYCQIN